jgi:hypothetical protein
VNLMVVAEGEEELGSPHFGEVIDKYEARLKTASGVFFPFNSQEPDGDVSMFLGVKGHPRVRDRGKRRPAGRPDEVGDSRLVQGHHRFAGASPGAGDCEHDDA